MLIVWNLLITDTNRTALVDLLLENRLERWVEFFADVFDEEPFTVLDTQFKGLHEGRVTELHGFKAVRALILLLGKVLNEPVCLVLRINHERPTTRGKSNDSIFNRQIIARKLSDCPDLRCDWVLHDFLHTDSV